MIRTGYNAELDELQSIMTDGKGILSRIEVEEKEKTGIKTLKVGYNRVFGYYIEVSKSNMSAVPDRYIRKQTLANGERYFTQELKDMEAQILGAGEKQFETAEAAVTGTVVDWMDDGMVIPPDVMAEFIAEMYINGSLFAKNKFSSYEEIIQTHYTIPLSFFKNASISRFKEAFKLIKNKENLSTKDGVELGVELFFNYNLHPAIIAACRNIDELDIYLACLDDNTLEDVEFLIESYSEILGTSAFETKNRITAEKIIRAR